MTGRVAVLLPHEMLEHIVPEGSEKDACKFSSDSPASKRSMDVTKERLGLATNEWDDYVGVGIWGGAAPYNSGKRDSLYLFLWNTVTGPNNRRIWMAAFPKRLVCQCGCAGRHTFNVVEVLKMQTL